MNQFKHDIREKDYHLTRNASEVPDKFQNKQLQDIVSVLKQSLDDEKNKNNELKRENSELKKELMNKSQSLKKFEKEIIQLKQIELKQNQTIKSLQDNIEKYRQTFLVLQSRNAGSNNNNNQSTKPEQLNISNNNNASSSSANNYNTIANQTVNIPLSAADEVFSSPTGHQTNIMFSEKSSSNLSNSKKEINKKQNQEDECGLSSSFINNNNNQTCTSNNANNGKKVPERKINLNASQNYLKLTSQQQQQQQPVQQQPVRADSANHSNNNNNLNSHNSSLANSKSNISIQKTKSVAHTPINKSQNSNNGMAAPNNNTSSFIINYNCNSTNSLQSTTNGAIQSCSSNNNNNNMFIFNQINMNKENQVNSLLDMKNITLQQKKDILNNSMQNRKKIYNKRQNIQNTGQMNYGPLNQNSSSNIHQNNEYESANNSINYDLEMKQDKSYSLYNKSSNSKQQGKHDESEKSHLNQQSQQQKENSIIQQQCQQPKKLLQEFDAMYQQDQILKEKQQNAIILADQTENCSSAKVPQQQQQVVSQQQEKLQLNRNLILKQETNSTSNSSFTLQQQQQSLKINQSMQNLSFNSQQTTKQQPSIPPAETKQIPNLSTNHPPLQNDKISKEQHVDQKLQQKEINDNDSLENIQEDIDEAANLEKLCGSHFKINVKESCKDLHVKTDFYFSKKEAPHSFLAKEGDHEQPATPSRVDNFDSLIEQQPMPMNSILQDLSPTPQQMQQPIMTALLLQSASPNKANANAPSIATPQQKQLQNIIQQNSQCASPSNVGYTNNALLQQQQQQQPQQPQQTERHQSLNEYSIINNKMKNFSKNNRKMSSEPVEKKMKNKSQIKMPGRMKRHLEEPQADQNYSLQDACAPVSAPTDIGGKLFESLLVFGPDKNEFQSLQTECCNNSNNDYDEQIGKNLSPQMYFKYPLNCEIDKGKENVMPHFVFPFGVETVLLSITDSLSQINEIIFSNNKLEANNNCFVFVMKTDDSYKKKSQMRHSKLPEHLQLLEICNPSHLLYGVCFKIKELIEYSDADQITQSKSMTRSKNNKRSIWATQKLFCFLTYYPFISFFLEIIASILNQLKMQRLEYYTTNLEQIKENQNVIYKFESEFFTNFINKECTKILDQLNKIRLPSLNRTIQLNYNNEFFQYYVPSKELARHLEASWSSSYVLSNLDEELFVTLFLTILLEHSIVFVSNNAALLSATLLVFHSLIKPFKWPHPLVFNLPDSFMHILDSPFPILVGLNKDKTFVLENGLPEMHRNCVFVMLDCGDPSQQQMKSNSNNSQIEIFNRDLISHIKEGPNISTVAFLLQKLSPYFDYLYDSTCSSSSQNNNKNNGNGSSQFTSSNNLNGAANYQTGGNAALSSGGNSHSSNSQMKGLQSYSSSSQQQQGSSSTQSTASQQQHQQSMFSSSSNNNMMAQSSSHQMQQQQQGQSALSSAASSRFVKSLVSSRGTVISASQLNAAAPHFQRKMQLIVCPTQEQKQACENIFKAVSEFIRHEIIEMLPSEASYINPQKKVLDFMFISDAMVKQMGYDDSFMKKFPKTQLFTYFLEEYYDKVTVVKEKEKEKQK